MRVGPADRRYQVEHGMAHPTLPPTSGSLKGLGPLAAGLRVSHSFPAGLAPISFHIRDRGYKPGHTRPLPRSFHKHPVDTLLFLVSLPRYLLW